MEVGFTHPVYLWGLLIIPVLIVLYFASVKYSKAMAFKFANFMALSRVSGGVGETSSVAVLSVRVFAIVCVVFAISGMTVWYVGETSNKDYVLAIDASASMMDTDFAPTRLDSAKTAAKAFIDNLPVNSYVAILSFSGVSFVDQPLTQEKFVAKEAVENISAKAVGGTDFGNAIITSTNLLMNSQKAKVIVLLTDGRSNIGIAEDTAIAYAIDNHVIVHTIGIGAEYDEEDYLHLGVDEESLNEIAMLTLGNYYRVTDPEDLTNVYTSIVKARSIGKNPVNLTFILLGIAFASLLADWILGNTIYKRIP